ncbi:MAG: hypothetical protein LBU36_03870 [Clostridiales bacterium]|nr:hypothetical protein [Clostridiales bacterium]
MFQAKLKLLYDILQKKRENLSRILSICENQETVIRAISDGSLERGAVSEFFSAMNEEKQTLIDATIACDDLFARVFDGIKNDFERLAPDFSERIAELKAEIKSVVEIDAKIRLQEERNKTSLASSHKIKGDTPSKSKARLLSEYRKNAGF